MLPLSERLRNKMMKRNGKCDIYVFFVQIDEKRGILLYSGAVSLDIKSINMIQ